MDDFIKTIIALLANDVYKHLSKINFKFIFKPFKFLKMQNASMSVFDVHVFFGSFNKTHCQSFLDHVGYFLAANSVVPRQNSNGLALTVITNKIPKGFVSNSSIQGVFNTLSWKTHKLLLVDDAESIEAVPYASTWKRGNYCVTICTSEIVDKELSDYHLIPLFPVSNYSEGNIPNISPSSTPQYYLVFGYIKTSENADTFSSQITTNWPYVTFDI